MEDEQTNKTDTQGIETDKALATDGQPLSDYDKALALVQRREEATKEEKEVLDRKEKLAANSMLGGTTGGHVEPIIKIETDKEYTEKFMRGEVNPLE